MDDNKTDDTRDDPDTTNHIKDTPTMDNDKGGDTRGANDSENITEAPTIKIDELDTTRLPTAIVLDNEGDKARSPSVSVSVEVSSGEDDIYHLQYCKSLRISMKVHRTTYFQGNPHSSCSAAAVVLAIGRDKGLGKRQ